MEATTATTKIGRAMRRRMGLLRKEALCGRRLTDPTSPIRLSLWTRSNPADVIRMGISIDTISTMDYRAGMTYDQADVDALLPLHQAEFHILLALSADDRHGYGIIQDVDGRTNGALRLSPGTLYRTIQRLLEQGLIEEPRKPATRGNADPRRRYYRITPL